MALVASACGSGTTADTDAAAPALSETTEAAPATGDTAATTAAPATGDEQAEVAPGENLFPAVDVVRITDGATLDLSAELGGGDLPVLLWFWAPH